jgi:protein import protein ZIM17
MLTVSRMTMPRTATKSPVLSMLSRNSVISPRSRAPSLQSFTTTRYIREQGQSDALPPKKTPIGQIERRLQITFTCTAQIPTVPATTTTTANDTPSHQPCHHRSTHQFSKRAYDHGIVLIECPSCKNRHLIGKWRTEDFIIGNQPSGRN